MSKSPHLTAREAADLLGITLPTLYAYVSRGQLRSIEGDSRRRTKKYAWDDVERLRQRQTLKRSPQGAVEKALNWGIPTVASAITLIADGRLYYRGHDATDLSRSHTFEQVAGLLWTGSLDPAPLTSAKPISPRIADVLRSAGEVHPVTAMSLAMTMVAEEDAGAYDLRPASTLRMGATLMHTLFAAAGSSSLVQGLANAWLVPQASPAIDAMLILCADHELNASSFTARCIASTGAGLPACLAGGIAALTGPKHGRSAESALAMIREVASPSDAPKVMTARLRRGDGAPGFGHPLYPAGDPRGLRALEIVQTLEVPESRKKVVEAVREAAQNALDEAPTIDFGLAGLAFALDLPSSAPLTLFALGRSVGWIAHAREEYERGSLIRPRAKYVGPNPGNS